MALAGEEKARLYTGSDATEERIKVVALARPFLAVGARTTMVTLWPVSDFSTASWMEAFYESLIRGEPKEQALRQARESMLGSQRPLWCLPYYWAPFVMIGDYR